MSYSLLKIKLQKKDSKKLHLKPEEKTQLHNKIFFMVIPNILLLETENSFIIKNHQVKEYLNK